MRISDWSSDVCSSDLVGIGEIAAAAVEREAFAAEERCAEILARKAEGCSCVRLPVALGFKAVMFLYLSSQWSVISAGWRCELKKDWASLRRATPHSDIRGMARYADREATEIGRAHVCTPVTNAHLVCTLI